MSTGGLTRGSSLQEAKHSRDKGSSFMVLRRPRALRCRDYPAVVGETDVKKSLCIEHVRLEDHDN